MLTFILAVALVYALVRAFLPIFVIKRDKATQWTKLAGTAIYQVYAKEKVIVPTGQWREIPTGVTVAPFGVVRIGKFIVYPFGRIGCRIYPPSQLKMKGVEILPTVYTAVPREEIIAIGTGWNPKGPFVFHKGDLVAYVEFYRIPNFTLWEIEK